MLLYTTSHFIPHFSLLSPLLPLSLGLFMLHAMMHFWNEYEVAAYDLRAVHSDNPR